MLEAHNISICYGPLKAVDNVSFQVRPGQIVALIGSNGAGKSTTLNALVGALKISSGTLLWNDQNVTQKSCAYRVRQGFALSPEGRRLFPRMTVLDNLLTGAYTLQSASDCKKLLDLTYHIFPRVAERRHQLAGSLSGGEQQMVAIGRALMAQPKILMLDEPSLGLAPKVTQEIAQAIVTINHESKMAVLLVEQNASLALKLSDYAYVYEKGAIIHSGAGAALLNDNFVQHAYLGI